MGESAARVDGLFYSGIDNNLLEANAKFTEQFTNNSTVDWKFDYGYSLGNPTLMIADYAGMSYLNEPHTNAYFDFEVTIDFGGGASTVISSNALLEGGIIDHNLTTGGTDPLTGFYFENDPDFPNVFGYDFTGFSGGLSSLARPGQTVKITSSITVGLQTPGFETGGSAWIGDPYNVGLDPGMLSGDLIITPVPEMETWAMMVAGMGFLGWRLRKKV